MICSAKPASPNWRCRRVYRAKESRKSKGDVGSSRGEKPRRTCKGAPGDCSSAVTSVSWGCTIQRERSVRTVRHVELGRERGEGCSVFLLAVCVGYWSF